MSDVFTLDAMRQEIEKKYAPMPLDLGGDTIELRNLLRLDKQDRDAVLTRLESMEAHGDGAGGLEEADALDAVQFVLKTVVADGQGEKLLAALGDDLLLYMSVLETWTEVTQPGEAPDSPS